ncbi:hypothetical protein NFI96_025047, partial [Prochilodus magdalenae]
DPSCYVLHKLQGINGSLGNPKFTVTGEDLKPCESQKTVCVLDTQDCGSVPEAHGMGGFSISSCRYHFYEKSLRCKWAYLKDVGSQATHSFIFTSANTLLDMFCCLYFRTEEIEDCPSIINLVSEFNVIIKSKDHLTNIERFSEAHHVKIEDIVEFPSPEISSVYATETSLNVTWTWRKQWDSKNCLVRYKQSTMDEWMKVRIHEEDSGNFHVIEGLHPFCQYSLAVACTGEFGLQTDWSAEFKAMTLMQVPPAPPNVSYCVRSLNYTSMTAKLLLVWALEHPHTVPADGAVGVEVEGHQVFWTCDNKPFILVLTTVPPHTDSLGVSTKTKAESLSHSITVWHDAIAVFGDSDVVLRTVDPLSICDTQEVIYEYEVTYTSTKQPTRNTKTITNLKVEFELALGDYNITLLARNRAGSSPVRHFTVSTAVHACLPGVQGLWASTEADSLRIRWETEKAAVGVSEFAIEWFSFGDAASKWKRVNGTTFSTVLAGNISQLQTYTINVYPLNERFCGPPQSIQASSQSGKNDDIVKAAIPLVLMLVGFGILSVLSRTVYKDYFFPSIANPGHSLIGRWLLNPLHERDAVLKLEDFSLANQFVEKALIQMEYPKFTEKEMVDEDMMYLPESGAGENSDGVAKSQTPPSPTEYADLPLLPDNFGYVENGYSLGSTDGDHL